MQIHLAWFWGLTVHFGQAGSQLPDIPGTFLKVLQQANGRFAQQMRIPRGQLVVRTFSVPAMPKTWRNQLPQLGAHQGLKVALLGGHLRLVQGAIALIQGSEGLL